VVLALTGLAGLGLAFTWALGPGRPMERTHARVSSSTVLADVSSGASQELPASRGLGLLDFLTGGGGDEQDEEQDGEDSSGRRRKTVSDCKEDERPIFEEVSKAFNDVGSKPNPGGLLVIMLDGARVKDWTELSLANVATQGCAAYLRKTCVVAHYLRKDLAPMVLNNPAHWPDRAQGSNPRVALVLDADKAFPLITGMFVVSADAYARNACSNEFSGKRIFDVPKDASDGAEADEEDGVKVIVDEDGVEIRHNCQEGEKETWSQAKIGWCCAHELIACPDGYGEAYFDCKAGLERAHKGWSSTKKEHCCHTENICVGNYDGTLRENACIQAQAEYQGIRDVAKFFRRADDRGSKQVDAICKNEDERCKFLNTGGGMSTNIFGRMDACMNPNSKHWVDVRNCFTFAGDQVSFDGDCAGCSSPYVCVAAQTPNDRLTFSYNGSREEWEAFTGEGGSAFKDLFIGDQFRFFRSDQGQCKWKRDDFETYVEVTKETQKLILRLAEDAESAADSSSCGDESTPPPGYLWADPDSKKSFETEVSMYVNPDVSSPEYDTQNTIFRDAILAVAVDDRKCQDQLAFLNDGDARMTVSAKDCKKYESAKDRCKEMLEHGEPEDVEIEAAVEAARHLAELALKRRDDGKAGYKGKDIGDACVSDSECRSGTECNPPKGHDMEKHGTPMWTCQLASSKIFRFTPSSSLAPESETWEKAAAGAVDPSDLFHCHDFDGGDGQDGRRRRPGGDGGSGGSDGGGSG
jgi:hypothetical protein